MKKALVCKLRTRLLAIISLVILFGCGSKATAVKLVEFDEGEIRVSIKEHKVWTENSTNYSLVYGQLNFSKIQKNEVNINLDCITIRIGKLTSKQIYVDSLAHILTSSYKISESTTKVPVYWKLSGVLEEKLNFDSWMPVIKESCEIRN